MKRWPLIRHIRYFLLAREFRLWWEGEGHMLGAFPNEADLRYLEDVWKGRA